MKILINVIGQKMKMFTPIDSLVSGSQNFVSLKFNLSEDWSGLTVFAQFMQNGTAYNKYLDQDSSVYLPTEIKEGTCTVVLYGTGSKTIATSNYLTFVIDKNIIITNAQSTEISSSLYSQLVGKVDELQASFEDMTNSNNISSLISDAVTKEMDEYLTSGKLANMAINDGSITREKVDDLFESTLVKADNSMQKSVYDTAGLSCDVYTYAQNQAKAVQENVNAISTEIKDGYTLEEGTVYTSLGDAIRGAVTLADKHSEDKLAAYKTFTTKIVEELPSKGEDLIFYLVPGKDEGCYDKYWWISDSSGNEGWDYFGTTKTEIVSSLPAVGNPDTDYLLNQNSSYVYYKYIEGKWAVVSGSMAKVVETLPSAEDGNTLTDYYIIQTGKDSLLHYRFYDGNYHIIGGDCYTKEESDSISSQIKETINSVSNEVNGIKEDVEGLQSKDSSLEEEISATKEELSKLADVPESIDSLRSSVNENKGKIQTVETKIESLGNLVSDITESDNGISVHYQDGSSKSVDTKDSTVKVEDINKSESGITILYTDGESKEIEISGGGGGTSSGSASITRITDASVQCVYGDNCDIVYSFNAIDSAGDIVGDGEATWYVGNIKKATSAAKQGENTFNIGEYLSVGSNNVKLSIVVDTGGESPVTTTKSWTVNAINMYAEWEYDDTTVNEASEVTLRWTPYGDLEKTTHILIDGVEVVTSKTTRSGVVQYATITKYAHGSHMAELYLTATVNGKEIRSESIFHDMIFANSGNNTPIISCPISETTMTQYNTITLPIAIYHPGKLTTDATLLVDDAEVATWSSVDRTIHYWNYTPSDFGGKVLKIVCGETEKVISVMVDELDIDSEEIPGYAFRLKASDIASNEALKEWKSNEVGISFSDNFDWNSGGIQSEIDGPGNVRQFICVKAGTYATINYQLFGNDPRTTGKNFKIIFKTANCRNYDAVFMDCIDNGIGISLGANGGTASSEQNSVSVQYAENSYTEFEFDIRPDSSYRYIQTYLDGVLTSTNIYASDDNFTQTNKKNIVLGSPDCDLHLYLVKAYEAYLTPDNHIENFIADAPNAKEMVQRYNRNDILSESGEISYEKLATQNPECRVHLWDIPRMTEGKKDYVSGCSYQQIYKAGSANHQLAADNVTISIQGTSSVDYKDSGANTDGNFTGGFTDGNGKHIRTYSMEDGSIGVNYFNTKVNIASCENINNMCLAEWYNRYQPYTTAYRAKNANARDCMELHMGVQFIKDQSHGLFEDDNYHMYAICNMGNSKKNSAVFHDSENPLECCIETKDNNSTYCMMLDPEFNETLLDSESYFEFRYPSSPTQEMKTSFINLVKWFANGNPAKHTDEALSSPVTFEPYTFKGTGQSGEVLAGLTISEYAGTYTNDTYEYRMAKMLSECEDHLIMDSMVYHYVFVEQHALVDNVCKNTFWGTEDLVHWHLAKNYDNDTGDGNNNEGKLVIPFGSEGYDNLGDGAVFNGRDNVYWNFIYGLYEARQKMWTNREAAGAWNADSYLAFVKSYQDILPERVYNQDYWYKYLRLYEQKSVETYLPMLEGGKKTHQREAFVTNNFYYMASQYMGTACTSKSITLRGYSPSTWAGVQPKAELNVTLYNKGYIVTQVGSILKRVKAERGKPYTIVFTDSGDMNDTVINIHGANMVQAVGDISCLYVGRSDFSAATRLRSLQIGSTAEGYKNTNLTEIGFGSNTMLEHLYIQNCPNVKTTLDLSGCPALLELDVRGSGFTGITFAVGGLLEKALLCSPASLNMRELYYIEDENLSLEEYSNLTTIRLEGCSGIDSLSLVNKAENLSRVRILELDWTLPTTDLLNKMLILMGIDESDHNVETAVLTGKVYISGQVRKQELEKYAAAWENLSVTYDPENMVEQYVATYINSTGEELYRTYVDSGSTPPDPVLEGYISTPTMEADAQYTYTYSGWDGLSGAMISDRTITAVYDKTVREYTVTWYSRAGLSLGSKTAQYGAEVVYEGETPTNTTGESTYSYNVFTGWDKSTGFITEDTDVYAVWEKSGLPSTSTDLKDMTDAEIYAIATAKKASDYLVEKDFHDITLGHDFNFSNIESEVIAEKLILDGKTATKTNIQLFGENEKTFTLAIDFQFSSDEANNTLLSCFEENGSEGFRLCYRGGYPNIQWGNQSNSFGYKKFRDIVVLRHIKGEDKLYIYASNGTDSGTRFSSEICTIESVRNRSTSTNSYLTIGGVLFGDGSFDYYGSGKIHWCKIWYGDLGENNAKMLAAWPHETLRMEFSGTDRYRLIGDTSKKANISFIANNLLAERGYRMNSTSTNSGGWDASAMREFCNTRLLAALPISWQSMVKKVKVNSSAGNKSNEIVISEDKIYLESMTGITNDQTATYAEEGKHISWFTSELRRVKFKGAITSDSVSYYTSAEEPSTLSSNSVKIGDVWYPGNSGTSAYICISIEDYAFRPSSTAQKHGTITSDGTMAWVASDQWWMRSPCIEYSTYFMSIYGSGSYGFGSPTSSYGICPCFSV